MMNRREFMLRSAVFSAATLFDVLPILSIETNEEQPLAFQEAPAGWTPSKRVGVPMRDGARLTTDIWLPEGDGPFPAILVRTCYSYQVVAEYQAAGEQFNKAGYAFIMQSIRGQWGSEGKFRFGGHNEKKDGYDAVEWVAAQPWCDGSVGMIGTSYLAMTQLYAAEEQPPHLKAISPCSPVTNFFEATPFIGGAFALTHMLTWTRLIQPDVDQWYKDLADPNSKALRELQRRLRHRPLYTAADGWLEGPYLDMYKEFLDHPLNDDSFWDEVNFTDDTYSRMDVPMFWVGGNFDISTRHCVDAWNRINALAPANPHYMVIGPWQHGPWLEYGLKETELTYRSYKLNENAVTDNLALRIPFFERHLKGLDVDVNMTDRVRVFITGSNVWRDFSDMPVPEADVRTLYLSSYDFARSTDGSGLASFEAGSPTSSDTVLVDPENPVKGTGESFVSREDVLVYTSLPLEEPLTIVGQPQAILHVTSETQDADVAVGLYEVFPDNTHEQLSMHLRRLRYRKGYEKPARFMTPGKPEEIKIPLDWIGHTLKPGSRLRVTVSGTIFPIVNPNTGEPIKLATRMQRTKLTLVHTEDRPSRLEIPTIAV
jgi:putative CocE/NonD family hydrolase